MTPAAFMGPSTGGHSDPPHNPKRRKRPMKNSLTTTCSRLPHTLLALLAVGGPAVADTLTVDCNGTKDYTTIQAAVNAASNGDEIVVAPGVYTDTGHHVVDMLGKAITLRASGTPQETIIDGQGSTLINVIVCENYESTTTIIKGFTITGGTGANGAGVFFLLTWFRHVLR